MGLIFSQKQINHFCDGLNTCFNLPELKVLFFELGGDFDNLRGETKAEKAIEIFLYFRRLGETGRLLDYCCQKRPNYRWYLDAVDSCPPTNIDISFLQEHDSGNLLSKASERSIQENIHKIEVKRNVTESPFVYSHDNGVDDNLDPLLKYRETINLLEQHLVQEDWEQADRETISIFLYTSNREKDGWLRKVDVKRIPCDLIRVIDQLWTQYSDGRFGFSRQCAIRQQLITTDKVMSLRDFYTLSQVLGWSSENEWQPTSSLVFSDRAKLGHLPSLRITKFEETKTDRSKWFTWMQEMFKKFDSCLDIE